MQNKPTFEEFVKAYKSSEKFWKDEMWCSWIRNVLHAIARGYWWNVVFQFHVRVPDKNGWFDGKRGEWCWPWNWYRRYYERSCE